MDNSSLFESPRSMWLTGRGTKVLYFAVVLAILGAVGMGQSVQTAKADATQSASEQKIAEENARSLAKNMLGACNDAGFRAKHATVCAQAVKIAEDPTKPAGSASGSSEVLETLGVAP